jgi:hypothetical protein
MRTRYPQAEKTDGAIATHLAVCALVCGLLGFGFYKLMEPTQAPNPGVAAYKPPPGTVITYSPATQFAYERQAAPDPGTDQPLRDTPDETTGRAVQIAEPATAVTLRPDVGVKKTPAAKARVRTVPREALQAASTERPSGAFAAAYPGYAAIH